MSFDAAALESAAKEELNKLNGFKKIGFVGRLINAACKAQKAKRK